MKTKTLKMLLAGAVMASMAVTQVAPVMAAETEAEAAAEEEEDEENYMTGDASMDDPLSGDEIGDNEILVVSFGTSYNYSRYADVGGIERAIQEAFPDWSVRRAFTANIVIDHVASRDGEIIDDVDQALQRSVDNGVKNLVVAMTHLMEGHEYTDVVEAVAQYADNFESVAITESLLGPNDALVLEPVVDILVNLGQNYDDGETAIVYMGHGTDAESDDDYGALQDALTAGGHDNYYITTVESETWNTERVLEAIADKGYTKVVLRPLMVVAGDHAHNDMAGMDEDTLRTMFAEAGYEVDCVLDGLGQVPAIQDLYVEHVQAAIDSLAE